MKPILAHPSYYDIEKGCARICADILKSNYSSDPDVIIGLTRGGLLPAVIISHILEIQMNAVSYSSYKGMGDDKNHINMLPIIPHPTQPTLKPRILLVDDIMDSGRTIEEVKTRYINDGYDVRTASLYWKTSAVDKPDFFWQEIPDDSPWIIFPWEL